MALWLDKDTKKEVMAPSASSNLVCVKVMFGVVVNGVMIGL